MCVRVLVIESGVTHTHILKFHPASSPLHATNHFSMIVLIDPYHNWNPRVASFTNSDKKRQGYCQKSTKFKGNDDGSKECDEKQSQVSPGTNFKYEMQILREFWKKGEHSYKNNRRKYSFRQIMKVGQQKQNSQKCDDSSNQTGHLSTSTSLVVNLASRYLTIGLHLLYTHCTKGFDMILTDPKAGIPWNNPLHIFATPNATNSLFALTE